MSVDGAEFGAVALTAAARDLTAPLVLIRQLSFQLDGQLAADSSPATSQVLDELRLTVQRTFAITDQLKLAIQGLEQLTLEPVQLTGLCCDLDNELSELRRVASCQVDFELPRRQRPVVAVGNYQALKTVLLGFLTDAIRYNDLAGGNSADQPPQRLVRLRVATNRDGTAVVSVRDNGPWLNMNQSLKSAELSNNLNPTGSRPLMGSLNLLLADRLMRAMHGKLAIHNHRRGGITVETSLPISQQMSLLGDM